MIQFLVRRFLLLILVMWGLVTIVFLLVTVLPGTRLNSSLGQEFPTRPWP